MLIAPLVCLKARTIHDILRSLHLGVARRTSDCPECMLIAPRCGSVPNLGRGVARIPNLGRGVARFPYGFRIATVIAPLITSLSAC
jgi:hypothetical protein